MGVGVPLQGLLRARVLPDDVGKLGIIVVGVVQCVGVNILHPARVEVDRDRTRQADIDDGPGARA